MTSFDLIGTSVYDQNDSHVGEIADVIATDEEDAEAQVIIDVGGFLGIGEHSVALTMADLSVVTDEDGDVEKVTILRSKSELEALPEYES
jgi:hypothetical protein